MDAQTHARTHGQPENSIPTTNKVCGGITRTQLIWLSLNKLISAYTVLNGAYYLFIRTKVRTDGHGRKTNFNQIYMYVMF